jgi:hypothetical protein
MSALAPVVASLQANFGDFMAKTTAARAEWSKTTESIQATTGKITGAVAANERMAEAVARSSESLEVLRESSRETFGSVKGGLANVLPGFGELAGVVGSVRGQFVEMATASREAFSEATSKARALKLDISRVTEALAATEAQMEQTGAMSTRQWSKMNEQALAYKERLRGLNAELATTAREMRATSGIPIGGAVKRAAAGTAAVGLVVGAAVGYEGVKAAYEQEAALAVLKNAVEKTKTSYKSFEPALEETLGKMRGLGYTNTQTTDSTARLTQMLGSTDKALRLTGLAAAVARARHIDLASATQLVGRVANGHVASLGRMGLASKDAAGKTLTTKGAIDELARAYGGTAEAYSHTLKGQMAQFHAQLDNQLEKIGVYLIPKLTELAHVFGEVGHWIKENLIPPIMSVAHWIGQNLVPAFREGTHIIGGAFKDAIHSVTSAFGSHREQMGKVGHALQKVADFILHQALPAYWKLEAFMIKNLGHAIGFVVQALSFLVDQVGTVKRAFGGLTAFLINDFIRPTVVTFLQFATKIVGAADSAFGWVPGLGGKLDKAKSTLKGFATATDVTLSEWAKSANHWGDEHTAALTDAAVWQAQLMAAMNREALAEASGDPRQIAIATAAITRLKAAIAAAAKSTDKKETHEANNNYSEGFSDEHKATTKHHAKAHAKAKDHHAQALAQAKAHYAALLAAAKKHDAEMQARAVAAAVAAGAKKAAALQAEINARNEIIRQMTVQQNLTDRANQQLDLVNGGVVNRGVSFQQLANQGGTTVNLTVMGNVMAEKDLHASTLEAIQQFSRTNGLNGKVS